MRKCAILLSAAAFSLLAGCMPNLRLQSADPAGAKVTITEINNGNRIAGPHLTYIEINQVGAAQTAKPQSQYSVNVPAIPPGGSWSSGFIPFSQFSSKGLNLSTLTHFNLVVRVDAKNAVKESNENDNLYDVDH